VSTGLFTAEDARVKLKRLPSMILGIDDKKHWHSVLSAQLRLFCSPVNYPALKGAASCFIELASKRTYAISTGVDYSVWAVPALQQIVHSGCLVLATQILSISRNEEKKTIVSKRISGRAAPLSSPP
jgi:hypothetical protein